MRQSISLQKIFVERFKENIDGPVVNIISGQSLSAMSVEIAYALTIG